MKQRFSAKELTMMAMISAIAFALVSTVRIPVVLFLKYEPKDVVILVGGFLLGPWSVLITSGVVSLLEMVTISDTGPIGCIMNFLSTCSFACVASLVYKKKHTMGGAIAGLAIGTVFMTVVMLLWNYLVTPLYMGLAREAVAGLLIPAFLPFNLLKAGLNSSITLLLYKPLVGALRRSRFLVSAEAPAPSHRNTPTMLFALLLLITCVLFVLVLRGVI